VVGVGVEGLYQEMVGVMHFGSRPSVGGADPFEVRLEIHLLDFNGDLYGKTVSVTVLEKIREVMRFSGLGELKAQIAEDISLARVRVYGP
jgi:riboflavin kinase/FMN adenylyltransferase